MEQINIKLDDTKHVVAFASLGSVNGDINYNGDIPSDFRYNCRAYQLIDNKLVKDPNYKPPEDKLISDSSKTTTTDNSKSQIEQLTMQLAQTQAMVANLTQQIANQQGGSK